MKKIIILMLILTAFIGCSKRKNPVAPEVNKGTLWTGHLNSEFLDTCFIPQSAGRDLYVYEPANYNQPSIDTILTPHAPPDTLVDTTYQVVFSTTAYPVLYLLHGFGGNYKYFNTLFDVKNLLDQMIADGEIEPMVVVMPDADNSFGGGFYADSPRDSFIVSIDSTFTPADTTIDTLRIPPDTTITPADTTIDTTYFAGPFSGAFESYIIDEVVPYVNRNFNVDSSMAHCGIAGHSMGGYGAYRLAMDHPALFGSVAAMSAPVSFRGLLPLIPSVYAENGFSPGDTAGFYSIMPSSQKRLTSMMFAMGAAFSPHGIFNPDTALFHRVVNTHLFIGVDLPFAIDGTLDTSESSLWATKWLANDITTRFVLGGALALQNKRLYLDCGDTDDLYLQYQNRALFQIIQQAGFDSDHIQYTEYAGYSGYPAGHVNFVNDRLREVLKFHDRAFRQ
jgi:S-formylglutathione hydrolase FrmB